MSLDGKKPGRGSEEGVQGHERRCEVIRPEETGWSPSTGRDALSNHSHHKVSVFVAFCDAFDAFLSALFLKIFFK